MTIPSVAVGIICDYPVGKIAVICDCSFKPIMEYIEKQFDMYLQEELKVKRSLHTYHDTRIHACLYFITPTGHS